MNNPFDILDLDPRLSIRELTEALRRRAERATEEEREEIQRAWRQITMRERDRLRWAFFAHPRPPESGPGSIANLRDETPRIPVRHKSAPLDLSVVDLMDGPEQPQILEKVRPQWKLMNENEI